MILNQLMLILLGKLQIILLRYTISEKFRNCSTDKIRINFFEDVRAGKVGYALVLTMKLASISSDGQRDFDLI